jgi:hypothetical protein
MRLAAIIPQHEPLERVDINDVAAQKGLPAANRDLLTQQMTPLLPRVEPCALNIVCAHAPRRMIRGRGGKSLKR